MKSATVRRLSPLLAVFLAACAADSAEPGGGGLARDGAAREGSDTLAPDASKDGGSSTEAGSGAGASNAARVGALLVAKEYRGWVHESEAHASTGPHAGAVLVFLNDVLAKSFAAGNGADGKEHPKGSVAVKEFLDAQGRVTGWAYSEKVADASGQGSGWYWYEVFSPTDTSSPIEGTGKALCANCHAGGRDFVLIPYPLR